MKRALLLSVVMLGCATATPFAAPTTKPLHAGLRAAASAGGTIDEAPYGAGLPAVRPTPAMAAPHVLEARTKNGVRILGLERRDLPTVSFAIALKIAASDDDPGGFDELALDAIRRSTAAHEAGDIYSRWDQLAVWWHTKGVGERGRLFEISAVRPLAFAGFGPALDLFAAPGLRSEDVENARDAIVGGLAKGDFSASDLAYDLAMMRLFPKSNVFRMGDADGLGRVTASQLRAFATRALTSDNVVVTAAGDLDWKRVIEHVEDGLGALPHGALVPAPLGSPPPSGALLVPKSVAQTEITFAFRAPPLRDADRAPLGLAREAIGAQLFRSLRLTHGVTYGSAVTLYVSSLVISTSVEPGAVLRGIDGVLDALDKATNLAEADVARDRELAQSQIYSGFGTNRGAVERLAFLGALDLPIDYYAERSAAYASVGAADVARVVQKYLRRDLAQVVVVGDVDGLGPELEQRKLGPVELRKR